MGRGPDDCRRYTLLAVSDWQYFGLTTLNAKPENALATLNAKCNDEYLLDAGAPGYVYSRPGLLIKREDVRQHSTLTDPKHATSSKSLLRGPCPAFPSLRFEEPATVPAACRRSLPLLFPNRS